MPQFRYSDLPLGDDRTRLLRLLPNEENTAPIKCQLLNYSLQKNRNGVHLYDALSYVWGDPARPQVIYIEDGEFKVNQNLHSALRRLRDPTFERILWVDAICINQADDKEKERQIQAMGKIYARANQVVVWLGDEADNSDKAMEGIRVKVADSYGVSEYANVVQEVGLARDIRVLCGSAEISGHAFGFALRGDKNPAVRATSHNIGEALFRRQDGTDLRKDLSLGELIDAYHTHDATLRHDKIYALLGMSSDGSSAKDLLPNYELPWEALFERLIKHVLSAHVSVRIGQDKDTAVIQAKGWVLGRVHEVQSSKRPARNLNLVWSWKKSSTNTDFFSSKPSETLPAIDQMIWDANIILHDAADNAKSAMPAMLKIAEMLLVFQQKLKYHHPKTQLGVYGLALLNAASPRIPRYLYISQILNDMFPRVKLREMLGTYFDRWRYWDDERFVTGNLSPPSFRQDKFDQLIVEIEKGKKYDWHPFKVFSQL
ncbi:hypothetical protein APSETT444_005171 [Aspergillus pseudonomiae]